jgi:hypothetical protein
LVVFSVAPNVFFAVFWLSEEGPAAKLGLLQERVFSLLEARCRLPEERQRRRRVRKAIAVAMPSAPKKKIKPKPPEEAEPWPGLKASLEQVKKVKRGVVLTPAGGSKDARNFYSYSPSEPSDSGDSRADAGAARWVSGSLQPSAAGPAAEPKRMPQPVKVKLTPAAKSEGSFSL